MKTAQEKKEQLVKYVIEQYYDYYHEKGEPFVALNDDVTKYINWLLDKEQFYLLSLMYEVTKEELTR